MFVSDNLGRRTEDGHLQTIEDFEELNALQLQRYQGKVWATERFGTARLPEALKLDLQLWIEIRDHFEDKYSISLSELRQKVAIQLESEKNK